MKFNFMAYSGTSVLETDRDLSKLIRADARKAGWPAEIVKALKVSIKELKVTAYYPLKYADVVEDLEYGNQDNPPRPVFRRFLVKNEAFVFNKLTSQSVDYLFDSGVLP